MSFWRDEFCETDIEFALDKVRSFRKIDSSRNVTLSGSGEPETWTAFLVSALGIDVASGSLRRKIIRRTLFSPDLEQSFTEYDFRRVVYQFRNRLQNEEQEPFKVVFPIWNLPDFLHGKMRLNGVSLTFNPSVISHFYRKSSKERKTQQADKKFAFHFSNDNSADLKRCNICIAHVKANDATDAYERASDALYCILGLVNLAKDAPKRWRQSLGIRGSLPVSEVLIAPHITTHRENGTLTHDGFWYENWGGGPKKVTAAKIKESWEKRFHILKDRMEKSKWRQKCEDALTRYFIAFSNPNLDDAFLDGWRLFENVTGARTDKIPDQIKRVSMIFEDHAEHRLIGKHLELRRNLISHGHAIQSDDEETIAFQMLRFVAPYMEFFIMNAFNFNNPKEFWDFLDLPDDRETRRQDVIDLTRHLYLLEKAREFRREVS